MVCEVYQIIIILYEIRRSLYTHDKTNCLIMKIMYEILITQLHVVNICKQYYTFTFE